MRSLVLRGALPGRPVPPKRRPGIFRSLIIAEVAYRIRYVHSIGGHPIPTADERVKAVVRGIRRTHGTAPRRMEPATSDCAIAPRPDGSLTTLRDRALLLLGFAGAGQVCAVLDIRRDAAFEELRSSPTWASYSWSSSFLTAES